MCFWVRLVVTARENVKFGEGISGRLGTIRIGDSDSKPGPPP